MTIRLIRPTALIATGAVLALLGTLVLDEVQVAGVFLAVPVVLGAWLYVWGPWPGRARRNR